jgi:hypothetical protein
MTRKIFKLLGFRKRPHMNVGVKTEPGAIDNDSVPCCYYVYRNSECNLEIPAADHKLNESGN